MAARKIVRLLFYCWISTCCLLGVSLIGYVMDTGIDDQPNHPERGALADTQIHVVSIQKRDAVRAMYSAGHVKISSETTFPNKATSQKESIVDPALLVDAPPLITVMDVTRFYTSADVTSDVYHKPQTRVVNNWNFQQIIHEDICGDVAKKNRLVMVAMVMTQIDDVENRIFIRRTWGSEVKTSADMRIVFVVGKREAKEYNEVIKAESDRYRDIIQFDYVEDVNNSTIQTMAALKWAARHCPRAGFIVKLDAAMLMNVNILKKVLQGHNATNAVIGRNIRGVPTRQRPLPDPPSSQYPYPNLPNTTMAGQALAVSMSAASVLLRASYYVPYVEREDVYVTGILPHVSDVSLEDDSMLWTNTKEQGSIRYTFRHGKVAGVHESVVIARLQIWNMFYKYTYPGTNMELRPDLEWVHVKRA